VTKENINVTFQYDTTKHIMVKNTRLSSLFYNLMTNAIKLLLKIDIKENRELFLRVDNVNEVLYIEHENKKIFH